MKRKYGLFEKQDGKWVRLYPSLSFYKEQAVRMFQNELLKPYLEGGCKGVRELRPLKSEEVR